MWQPIETAPKDDIKSILIFNKNGQMAIARWSGWGGGVWRCAVTGHNLVSFDYGTTHWMPLPEPPKEIS